MEDPAKHNFKYIIGGHTGFSIGMIYAWSNQIQPGSMGLMLLH